MQKYMTRAQFERHRRATEACQLKLDAARKKVGKAAEHGDLSENAEYEAAIEESGFLAGRVAELQQTIVGVQVIDPRQTDPDFVSLGKTVSVKDAETDAEETYHVVGVGVTQTDMGEVSYSAPLGGSLVGSRVGDVVTAKLPGGTRRLEILSIAVYDA